MGVTQIFIFDTLARFTESYTKNLIRNIICKDDSVLPASGRIFFSSSGIDAGIFLDNYVNSTIVDAIVACVTRPFEVMVLNMQDILASALHEGGYQFIHEIYTSRK